LPDTQYYSQDYPTIFDRQCNWIVYNQEKYNIQVVLHEGDVVNADLEAQWNNADASIGILDDAEIPYLLAIGNHDYASSEGVGGRLVDGFNGAFPQSRYTAHGWWDGGFYEADHTENSYLLRTINGTNYIFLNLEFGPRDAVLTWADALLTTYASRTAIIVTHSHVYIDGELVTTSTTNDPTNYFADANVGADVWTDFIKEHDNVVWVQNGHHLSGNAAHRTDTTNGGTVVGEVFANWQAVGSGGNGWLRLVTFSGNNIITKTYSPYLNQRLDDADNEFTITR
jgi:hypothetical protein